MKKFDWTEMKELWAWMREHPFLAIPLAFVMVFIFVIVLGRVFLRTPTGELLEAQERSREEERVRSTVISTNEAVKAKALEDLRQRHDAQSDQLSTFSANKVEELTADADSLTAAMEKVGKGEKL
jgi:Tfp pilus assembly protein PilO